MKKILVVDDNKDLRYTITVGMKNLTKDYEFTEAESGESALRLVKGDTYDAILLDIMMPGMDGWDVAAALKKDEKTKNTPIIFLTAKTDDLSKGMGKLSAADYVTKPYEIEDLKNRIDKLFK